MSDQEAIDEARPGGFGSDPGQAGDQSLRESEERLRLALQAGRMGSWEWNVATNAVIWSPGLEAIHGLAPGTFEGSFAAYQSDMHPEDRTRVLQAIRHTLEHGEDHHIEYRIVRPDGSTRWVEGRGRLFRDQSGAPLRLIGVCTDITERRQAEEQLRRSEREIADIFENAPVGLHWVDADGTVLRVNQAELDLLGYRREEVVGKPIAQLHVDRAAVGALLESFRRGDVLRGYPAQLRCKDGSVRDVLINSSTLFEHGTFVHARCFIHDVTEQKRVEQALRSSEARLTAEASALGRLAEAGSRLWQLPSLADGLDEMLAAMIALLGADMGHVQLLDAQRAVLTIAAHRGFEPVLLQQVGEVTAQLDWASSRAMRTGQRIVIEDTETDEAYAPLRPIARACGYRAVQATPLVGRDGALLGMLSTHFRAPHRPSEQALRRLDLYVRQAADFIERCRIDEALRESEQRFARFMQHFPGLAWIKDLDGRYIYANEAAQRAFRRPQAELYGRTDGGIFPPETATQFRDNDRRALDSETGIQTVEMLEQEDGVVHHSLVSKFPILGPEGRIACIGGMAVDVTDRMQAEARIAALNDDLRRRLEELETLLGSLPVGVFIAHDPQCTQITTNPAGAAMLRIPQSENASKSAPGESLPFRVVKDGVEVAPEDLPMQRAAKLGEAVAGEEMDVVFPDGSTSTLYEYAAPLFDADGAVRGGLGVFLDITERKRAEARQQLLLEELNHRVKNTLAIVQSMVAQTLREMPEPAAFKVAFSARLAALGRAHSLLTRELWQGASLHDIVSAALSPFGGDERSEAIGVDGPPVMIRPNAAVTLSLVIHELATNAVKHGALSMRSGAVSVGWAVSGERPDITLVWSEQGGPAIALPLRQGFGTRLIAASAEQLGGDASVAFRADGIEVRFRFPQGEPDAAA